MAKHTDVIHDWRATVVRWLLMHFSQDFLVLPVKKSDTSVKYKRQQWRAIVVRWLLIPFSQDFLVIPIKKSDMSVKYKRQLNLTHHKQEPQSSLA